MVTISVIYPRSDGATFDYDYYVREHLPLVERLWRDKGLGKVSALKGLPGADGSEPPYLAIALLEFESVEALQQAMTPEASAELGADLAKYSNVAPVIQVNAPL